MKNLVHIFVKIPDPADSTPNAPAYTINVQQTANESDRNFLLRVSFPSRVRAIQIQSLGPK